MMTKFEVWAFGKRRDFVWGFDEFDARARFSKQHGIAIHHVQAYEVVLCGY